MRSVGTFAYLGLFGRFSTSPAQTPTAGVERGRYLVNHISLCGDCHTPRNVLGVPKQSLYLAGASQDIGPLGEAVPNITPDEETGIGSWKRDEIADLLLKGTKPDFDNVQGLMYEVIEGTTDGYNDMTKEDALAIADYLKSIPPIKNKIQ
jgi:mono/diheme cytochrome c family protein